MAFKNGLIMNNPYPKNTFKMFGVGKSLGRVHKSKGSEVQTRPFPDPGDIDLEGLLIQLLSLCDDAIFFFLYPWHFPESEVMSIGRPGGTLSSLDISLRNF